MEVEGLFFDLNDYKFDGTAIGYGSNGTVYLAHNLTNGSKYAAKIVHTDRGFDFTNQKLLMREVLIHQKIDHPSIVKFYGFNFFSFKEPENFNPTILIEYVPNGTLGNQLKQNEPNSKWTPTIKYINMLGISHALKYLHKNGIIHRDIKAENILFDENYYPKLFDFGFSRIFTQSLTNDMMLKMTTNLGTLLYMAPELHQRCEEYGPGVDIFALGLIMYEIVSGKRCYFELIQMKTKPFEIVKKIVEGYRPEFTENMTQKMKDLLSGCWKNEAKDRLAADEIFNKLSNDFSYLGEPVDENEVKNYIKILKESMKE